MEQRKRRREEKHHFSNSCFSSLQECLIEDIAGTITRPERIFHVSIAVFPTSLFTRSVGSERSLPGAWNCYHLQRCARREGRFSPHRHNDRGHQFMSQWLALPALCTQSSQRRWQQGYH